MPDHVDPNIIDTHQLDIQQVCSRLLHYLREDSSPPHYFQELSAIRFACDRYWSLRSRSQSYKKLLAAANRMCVGLSDRSQKMLYNMTLLFSNMHYHKPILINIPYYLTLSHYPMCANVDVLTCTKRKVAVNIYDLRPWSTYDTDITAWPPFIGAVLYIALEAEYLQSVAPELQIRIHHAFDCITSEYLPPVEDKDYLLLARKRMTKLLEDFQDEIKIGRGTPWCGSCPYHTKCGTDTQRERAVAPRTLYEGSGRTSRYNRIRVDKPAGKG